VISEPKPGLMKVGFYLTHYGYFLQVSVRSGSNCHPYMPLL